MAAFHTTACVCTMATDKEQTTSLYSLPVSINSFHNRLTCLLSHIFGNDWHRNFINISIHDYVPNTVKYLFTLELLLWENTNSSFRQMQHQGLILLNKQLRPFDLQRMILYSVVKFVSKKTRGMWLCNSWMHIIWGVSLVMGQLLVGKLSGFL